MNKQDLFEKIFKEHLKVETQNRSIESLYAERFFRKIDYKPYYQRNYVWDYHKATYFIESILMGTEIPPLIFFNSNSKIEVIDGRQRFETILRFMKNEFSLTGRGLNILTQLKGFNYDSLARTHNELFESFLDANLRIIEFRLVNHPPLDTFLQDRVKKEIFSRYNSGITPLKKAEIDNAVYDNDTLTNYFKDYYDKNIEDKELVFNNFFKQPANRLAELPIEKIMSFTRRSLVLPLYPINYYARSTGRASTLSKLYDYYADENDENQRAVLNSFINKVRIKQ